MQHVSAARPSPLGSSQPVQPIVAPGSAPTAGADGHQGQAAVDPLATSNLLRPVPASHRPSVLRFMICQLSAHAIWAFISKGGSVFDVQSEYEKVLRHVASGSGKQPLHSPAHLQPQESTPVLRPAGPTIPPSPSYKSVSASRDQLWQLCFECFRIAHANAPEDGAAAELALSHHDAIVEFVATHATCDIGEMKAMLAQSGVGSDANMSETAGVRHAGAGGSTVSGAPFLMTPAPPRRKSGRHHHPLRNHNAADQDMADASGCAINEGAGGVTSPATVGAWSLQSPQQLADANHDSHMLDTSLSSLSAASSACSTSSVLSVASEVNKGNANSSSFSASGGAFGHGPSPASSVSVLSARKEFGEFLVPGRAFSRQQSFGSASTESSTVIASSVFSRGTNTSSPISSSVSVMSVGAGSVYLTPAPKSSFNRAQTATDGTNEMMDDCPTLLGSSALASSSAPSLGTGLGFISPVQHSSIVDLRSGTSASADDDSMMSAGDVVASSTGVNDNNRESSDDGYSSDAAGLSSILASLMLPPPAALQPTKSTQAVLELVRENARILALSAQRMGLRSIDDELTEVHSGVSSASSAEADKLAATRYGYGLRVFSFDAADPITAGFTVTGPDHDQYSTDQQDDEQLGSSSGSGTSSSITHFDVMDRIGGHFTPVQASRRSPSGISFSPSPSPLLENTPHFQSSNDHSDTPNNNESDNIIGNNVFSSSFNGIGIVSYSSSEPQQQHPAAPFFTSSFARPSTNFASASSSPVSSSSATSIATLPNHQHQQHQQRQQQHYPQSALAVAPAPSCIGAPAAGSRVPLWQPPFAPGQPSVESANLSRQVAAGASASTATFVLPSSPSLPQPILSPVTAPGAIAASAAAAAAPSLLSPGKKRKRAKHPGGGSFDSQPEDAMDTGSAARDAKSPQHNRHDAHTSAGNATAAADEGVFVGSSRAPSSTAAAGAYASNPAATTPVTRTTSTFGGGSAHIVAPVPITASPLRSGAGAGIISSPGRGSLAAYISSSTSSPVRPPSSSTSSSATSNPISALAAINQISPGRQTAFKLRSPGGTPVCSPARPHAACGSLIMASSIADGSASNGHMVLSPPKTPTSFSLMTGTNAIPENNDEKMEGGLHATTSTTTAAASVNVSSPSRRDAAFEPPAPIRTPTNGGSSSASKMSRRQLQENDDGMGTNTDSIDGGSSTTGGGVGYKYSLDRRPPTPMFTSAASPSPATSSASSASLSSSAATAAAVANVPAAAMDDDSGMADMMLQDDAAVSQPTPSSPGLFPAASVSAVSSTSVSVCFCPSPAFMSLADPVSPAMPDFSAVQRFGAEADAAASAAAAASAGGTGRNVAKQAKVIVSALRRTDSTNSAASASSTSAHRTQRQRGTTRVRWAGEVIAAEEHRRRQRLASLEEGMLIAVAETLSNGSGASESGATSLSPAPEAAAHAQQQQQRWSPSPTLPGSPSPSFLTASPSPSPRLTAQTQNPLAPPPCASPIPPAGPLPADTRAAARVRGCWPVGSTVPSQRCWPPFPPKHSALSPAYPHRLWRIFNAPAAAREGGGVLDVSQRAMSPGRQLHHQHQSGSAHSAGCLLDDDEHDRLVVALKRAFTGAHAELKLHEQICRCDS